MKEKTQIMRFNTLFSLLLLVSLAIFAIPKTKADSPPGAPDMQVMSIVNADTVTAPVIVAEQSAYMANVEHGARLPIHDAALLTPDYMPCALPKDLPPDDYLSSNGASIRSVNMKRTPNAPAETVLRR